MASSSLYFVCSHSSSLMIFQRASRLPCATGSRAFLLGLPVFHLRLCRGVAPGTHRRPCAARGRPGGPEAVRLAHGPRLYRNIHHAAIALRGNIGLLIGNQWPGSGEGLCVWRRRRRGGDWRCRWSCCRSFGSRGGCGLGGELQPEQTSIAQAAAKAAAASSSFRKEE